MARNGTNGPEKFLIESSREFIDVESSDSICYTSAVPIILLSSPVGSGTEQVSLDNQVEDLKVKDSHEQEKVIF